MRTGIILRWVLLFGSSNRLPGLPVPLKSNAPCDWHRFRFCNLLPELLIFANAVTMVENQYQLKFPSWVPEHGSVYALRHSIDPASLFLAGSRRRTRQAYFLSR